MPWTHVIEGGDAQTLSGPSCPWVLLGIRETWRMSLEENDLAVQRQEKGDHFPSCRERRS